MERAEREIKYLRAGLAIFEKYLLSDELYWSVQASGKPGELPYPSLTLSAMLLAQTRLEAYKLEGEEKYERQKIDRELDRLGTRWRVAWERKATEEFRARLKLWGSFMNEYRLRPEDHSDRYAYEVSRRVMLELLTPDAQAVPKVEVELLGHLDAFLRGVLITGKFIWEVEIMDAFPEKVYWYLYGRLR